MKPSEALEAHRTELRDLVARHGALRPRVFGSALRGNDTEESDLDLLVDPTSRGTACMKAKNPERVPEYLRHILE